VPIFLLSPAPRSGCYKCSARFAKMFADVVVTSAEELRCVIPMCLLIYLSVCLSAGLHKKLQADLAEIFREGQTLLSLVQLIRSWWQMVLLPPGE